MTVNETLQDRSIRHAHYFERYKTFEVNKIVRNLDKNLFRDLIKRMRGDIGGMGGEGTVLLTPVARKRLAKMTLNYAKLLKDGYQQMGREVHDSMVDTAVAEAEWQLKTLNATLPIDYDFIQPSVSRLSALANTSPIEGAYLKDYVRAMPAHASVGLERALTTGFIEGETTRQIMKRAMRSLDIDRNHVKTLVRTATTEMSTLARESVAERNTDVVKKIRYDATLDGRTTMICISLDGQVFDVNEGPRPPQHYNCRSTTSFVLGGWQQFGLTDPPVGVRSSMNGDVPRDTTYPEWLKKQPKAFQNDVLGKGRAELWRKGEVKIDKMVSGGEPIPLKELKKMD